MLATPARNAPLSNCASEIPVKIDALCTNAAPLGGRLPSRTTGRMPDSVELAVAIGSRERGRYTTTIAAAIKINAIQIRVRAATITVAERPSEVGWG